MMKPHTPAALLLLLAMCISPALRATHAHADDTKTRVVLFQIDGMVTDSCPALVKQAVRRIDGVQRVEASAKTKTVRVEYVEGRTSPEAIRKVIKDQTGFDARVKRKG
jgi:copper chaperone CopZ